MHNLARAAPHLTGSGVNTHKGFCRHPVSGFALLRSEILGQANHIPFLILLAYQLKLSCLHDYRPGTGDHSPNLHGRELQTVLCVTACGTLVRTALAWLCPGISSRTNHSILELPGCDLRGDASLKYSPGGLLMRMKTMSHETPQCHGGGKVSQRISLRAPTHNFHPISKRNYPCPALGLSRLR